LSVVAVHNLLIECKLPVEKILSFELTAAKDSHVRMQTTILTRDYMRRYITEANRGDTITVWIINEEGAKIHSLFAGQIDSLHMDYDGDFERIAISAVSSSILLDIEKKSRSFQDTSLNYFDVIYKITDDTKGADARLHVPDKLLAKPVIQYEETDWQFIKRLASHLRTSIVPDYAQALPRVHIGLKKGADIGAMDSDNYKTCFDPRYFTDGKLLNLSKSSFIYYDVESYELYNADEGLFRIGDRAAFLGQILKICEIRYALVKGYIRGVYRLASPAYYMVRQHYNDHLQGLALQGVVLETTHELIRVHLDIDEQQDPKTAYDYTWRPETGNLMYCMPEPGTRVSLYMQNTDEFSAICKNCDRTNGDKFPEAQRPEDRYLTTAYNKRMYWKPTEAGFISLDVNTYLKIDDAIGTIIDSSKHLLLQADEELTIDGKKVHLSAPKEVTIMRRKLEAPSVINICNNFDIIGNIGGFFTTKPPGNPKSQDSPFGEIVDFDISGITDMILGAVPAGSAAKSTTMSAPLSAALQGAFVAHLPNIGRKG